jgi:hypothetical protein
MNLAEIIEHCRNRPYMSGINRDKSRVLETQEVFTRNDTVIEDLAEWPDEIFSNPEEIFIDNSCGDGAFLSEVLIRKLQNGIEFETALNNIKGVDLQLDNVELCRERLLCGREDLRHVVEKNIVWADALEYHYRFDGSDPTDTDTQQHFMSLFEIS